MRHFLIIVAILLFTSPATVLAEELNGFDGSPWGTPIQSIQGESRDLLGGEVIAKRQPLSKLEASFNAHTAYKIYYFCRDAGLCGGKLFIALKKRLSNPDAAVDRIKSILGPKYGHVGRPGRASDLSWVLPGGYIGILSGVENGYPVVEVIYRGQEYLNSMARAEAAFTAKAKGSIAAWDFRF